VAERDICYNGPQMNCACTLTRSLSHAVLALSLTVALCGCRSIIVETEDGGVPDTRVAAETATTDDRTLLPEVAVPDVSDVATPPQPDGAVEVTPLPALGAPSDFNGDGISDLAVFQDDNGVWLISTIDGQMLVDGDDWGYPGTVPVAGDYDGDGGWDFGVYHPPTSTWYIRTVDPAQTLMTDEVWGPAGAVPVDGDYDGDGRADMALYAPGTGAWYVRTFAGETVVHEVTFGGPTAVPIGGDWDGDGADDLAYFDTADSTWHAQNTDGELLVDAVQWGYPGAIPLAGDFDGDGAFDPGVFDPKVATWYILSSETNEGYLWEEVWGPSGTVVVSADFDGDDDTELVLYDCDTGDWYARSTLWGEYVWEGNLGGGQAVPVGGRFLPDCTGGACRPGTCEPPVYDNIAEIGPAELAGPGGLMKPDIEVDSKSQPHIVAIKGGTELHLFHRLAGGWQGGFFAGLSEYHETSSDFNSPNIEIDPNDRAWVCSGVWGDPVVEHQNCPVGSGPAVWVVNSVADAPAKQPCLGPHDFPGNWYHGGHGMELALDPFAPDEAMVGDGRYSIHLTVSNQVTGTIEMPCGHGGEKTEIAMSPRSGQAGVLHALAGRGNDGTGFPYDGTYINSTMPKQEAWVLAQVYPHMLEQEGGWWSMGIDLANPLAAYIYAPLTGVTINIWDGGKMVYPPDNLYVVDPGAATCGNGMYRYAARWAPARGGGTFLCWTSPVDGVNHVKIRYLTYLSEANYGPETVVAPGNQCSIATDSDGHIHMTYLDGEGVKYRLLKTSL